MVLHASDMVLHDGTKHGDMIRQLLPLGPGVIFPIVEPLGNAILHVFIPGLVPHFLAQL